MEDLSLALKAMFSQMKGDDILEKANIIGIGGNEIKHLDTEPNESTVVRLLLKEDSCNYSIDQLSMISQVIFQNGHCQVSIACR